MINIKWPWVSRKKYENSYNQTQLLIRLANQWAPKGTLVMWDGNDIQLQVPPVKKSKPNPIKSKKPVAKKGKK